MPMPAAAANGVDPRVDRRNAELSYLHPRLRKALVELMAKISAAGLPFRVFEGFRTPQRQQYLLAQSQTGPKVTKAGPWQSMHQGGAAADLVVYEEGQWSWNAGGKLRQRWIEMRKLAEQFDLRVLDWELPHVELPLRIAECAGAQFINDGDASWYANLAQQARSWRAGGGSGAPQIDAERPALPATIDA